MNLKRVARELVKELAALEFQQPVTHVYNPLVYARKPYEKYIDLYGQGTGRAILFGMNPGPWGMAQTGVPFGEVEHVRDWLGVCEKVGKPDCEHIKRPVLGFDCPRSEVSGRRVWSWARESFKTPSRFFAKFFVANYCPLAFLESTGRNRTPDKLPAAEREPLFACCDRAMQRTVETLEPSCIVGIGAFAESRARAVVGQWDIPIHRILHPSPASPAANKGWAAAATKQLQEAGILT